MTDEQTRGYEVTQADREAAGRLVMHRMTAPPFTRQPWMDEIVQAIERGDHDQSEEVQMFARHAHEATALLLAENAKLREFYEAAKGLMTYGIGKRPSGFYPSFYSDCDEDYETDRWDRFIAAYCALEAAK